MGAFVKIAQPQGLLRASGNILRPSVSLTAQNNISTVQGKTYDFRDRSFLCNPPKNILEARYNCQDDVIFVGGRVTGQQSASLTWGDMKATFDGDALRSEQVKPCVFTAENFACYYCMDGFAPRPSDSADWYQGTNGIFWVIRGWYVRGNRDDFIENDAILSGLVEDCLVDGTFMGFSNRPGSGGGPGDNLAVLTIRNVLLRIQQFPYDTPSMACAQIFKWFTGSGVVDVSDCIFRVDATSVNHTSSMSFPPGDYSNVALVWLGGGAWPGEAAPAGVTIYDDTKPVGQRAVDGLKLWDDNRALWLSQHGARDANGDDFDFLHIPTSGPVSRPLTLKRAVSSVTPVARTLGLKRAVQARVTKTLSLKRALQAQVARTFTLKRAVLKTVARTIDLRRAVSTTMPVARTVTLQRAAQARVTKTLGLQRRILSGSAVGKDLTLRRAVLARATGTLTLKRALRVSVSRQLGIRRGIGSGVSRSLSLRRALLVPLTTIQRALALRRIINSSVPAIVRPGLSAHALRQLFSQHSPDPMLVLTTITHDSLEIPLRFTSDGRITTSRGSDFQPYPARIGFPDSTDDGPPRAQIEIDNVDQRIEATLRQVAVTGVPPKVHFELVMASNPDLVEVNFFLLDLLNTSANYLTVTGTLGLPDPRTMPFPAGAFTPGSTPGIF